MKHIPPKVLIMLGLGLLLSACLKNTDVSVGGSISIKPEYAIPIGSPPLKLGDYLNSINDLNPIDTMQLDTIDGFVYNDTLYQIPQVIEYSENVPFTLAGSDESDEMITAATFRTNVINYIPAEILLQVYLFDASGILIDSLYSDGPLTINAATTNDEGEVEQAYELLKHDTEFNKEKLDLLTNVTSIEIYNKVIIEDVKAVLTKYYSDQDLWLQLAVRVNTDLKLND